MRGDIHEDPGALVGQEAHIIARSPGGPRYAPLDVGERDGYANLLLLCANDHIEVDSNPERYTVQVLRELKRTHEAWVSRRLSHEVPQDRPARVRTTVLSSGTAVWKILTGCVGHDFVGPEGELSDEEAELVDDARQCFRDWGNIESDVTAAGYRAMREAQRSLQGQLDSLSAAGFLVLGGESQGSWLDGAIRGSVAVLRIIRAHDLSSAEPDP